MSNVVLTPYDFMSVHKKSPSRPRDANPYVCKIWCAHCRAPNSRLIFFFSVEFFDAALGELLQIILQNGVLGDCEGCACLSRGGD